MGGRVRRGDEVWIRIKPYRDPPVRGVVKDVLTRKSSHPRGLKVRLEDGRVGRIADGGGERESGEGSAFGALLGIAAVLGLSAAGARYGLV